MKEKLEINVELIQGEFGKRPEGVSLTQYVKDMVKELEKKHGFTEFHQAIHEIMKRIVDKRVWEYACARITGFEGQWLTAISYFLTNK
jgi:hypothetical protein